MNWLPLKGRDVASTDRSRRFSPRKLGVGVALTVALASCGQTLDRAGSVDLLMKDNPSLSRTEATCVIDGIADDRELLDIYLADPDELSDEETASLKTIVEACLSDESSTDTTTAADTSSSTTTVTSTAVSDPVAETSTTAAGDGAETTSTGSAG